MARFEDFIRRYFADLNRRESKHVVPKWLIAPHHIWSHGMPDGFTGRETVEKVRVVHVQKRYHVGKLSLLGQDVVCDIRIQSPRAATTARRILPDRQIKATSSNPF